MAESKKKGRGGARKGAGRKNAGKVTLSLYVLPETKAAIEEAKERQGVSAGTVIDRLASECLH